jgi:hypothetical protein
MPTRPWSRNREGSCAPMGNPSEQGNPASREVESGEGAGLAVGPVVAMRRGNARRAKGPCRWHSELESKAGVG